MISEEVKAIVKNAIAEDIGEGDHTTLATIHPGITREAKLIVKQDGILAGVALAQYIFNCFDPGLLVEVRMKDGSAVKKGDVAFKVKGSASAILSAERLVLNCMQRMSGIATSTNELVQLVKGFPADILDTRKTTPGFRAIEKWAVRIGGGINHRFGLYDLIMIKDNHVDYAGGITPAIQMVKDYLKVNHKPLKIIVEARNMMEIEEILNCGGIDRILIDNFSPKGMKEAVDFIGTHCETEASGGINRNNILEYAATGVRYISVGALTHQINSLDMSLKAL